MHDSISRWSANIFLVRDVVRASTACEIFRQCDGCDARVALSASEAGLPACSQYGCIYRLVPTEVAAPGSWQMSCSAQREGSGTLATLLANIEIADSAPVESLHDIGGAISISKVFSRCPRGTQYEDYALQQQGRVLHEPKSMAATATLRVREPLAYVPNRYPRSV